MHNNFDTHFVHNQKYDKQKQKEREREKEGGKRKRD